MQARQANTQETSPPPFLVGWSSEGAESTAWTPRATATTVVFGAVRGFKHRVETAYMYFKVFNEFRCKRVFEQFQLSTYGPSRAPRRAGRNYGGANKGVTG